jgi:BASS family bile acid:Na+ symporter
MNASPITAVLLPLALAFIMLYLGSTLQWTDFRAVLRRPRALAVGLVGQMLLLPALAWGVATGLGLDPVMAVGLMVLAACPGGVSSGLLTHLADGDVALSIALTAVTSVAAMFTLPLLLDASLQHFLGRGLEVQMPLGGMVRSMFLLTTLPVLLGMALRGMAQRAGRSQWVERVEPLARRVSTGLFLLIVLATFWSQRELLLAQLPRIGPACALLNAAVLAAAWALAHGVGLQRRDRIAVATECGLQNSALGIYVGVQLLGRPAMAVPSVVYALLMNVGAIALVLLLRRRAARSPGEPACCP